MLARLKAQIVHFVARAAEARARAAARVRAKAARARSFFRNVPSVLDVPPVLDVPAAIGISSGIPAPAARVQEQRPQTFSRDAVRVLAEAGEEMAKAGAASADTAADGMRDATSAAGD